MARVLHLTNDQYEVLYDLLDYKVSELESECTVTGIKLEDHELYKVFKQMKGES